MKKLLVLCLILCSCATLSHAEYGPEQVEGNLYRSSRLTALTKLDDFAAVFDLEGDNEYSRFEGTYFEGMPTAWYHPQGRMFYLSWKEMS